MPFAEIIRAPWWAWLLGALLAVSLGVVFLPVHPLAALAGLVAGGALAATGIVRSSLRIEVADGLLRAGPAIIPVELLGEVRPLDASGMRVERGPALDARAYLCMRGWVSGGVRIAVLDPADPTPYWIVSTRRPQALAAAVAARSDTSSPGQTPASGTRD